jgi:hypothetical protein
MTIPVSRISHSPLSERLKPLFVFSDVLFRYMPSANQNSLRQLLAKASPFNLSFAPGYHNLRKFPLTEFPVLCGIIVNDDFLFMRK